MFSTSSSGVPAGTWVVMVTMYSMAGLPPVTGAVLAPNTCRAANVSWLAPPTTRRAADVHSPALMRRSPPPQAWGRRRRADRNVRTPRRSWLHLAATRPHIDRYRLFASGLNAMILAEFAVASIGSLVTWCAPDARCACCLLLRRREAT